MLQEVPNQMTEFLFDFSQEVWNSTYKYHSEDNVDGTQMRVAKDLASQEKNPEKWTKTFYNTLQDFKGVTGGRITSNAGTGLHGTTYINCFVSGATGEDQDSIEGIFDALTRAAQTLKSEGGYGFCCNFIRPRGTFIHGVGVETPGAVQMLNLWDAMSSVITAGSGQKKKKKEGKNKIRKGAMMVTMSCWHPDIVEFITAKATPGVLSKFNMSVLCTDEFMEAVKQKQPWILEYPDTTSFPYKKEWDGDLAAWKAKGYPTIVYKTYKDANELWNIVMDSTYNRNEPGILFVDRMNELNNLYYCEKIMATNPCGEQILPVGGVCLLGSLNLTQFINSTRTGWDYDKLKKHIPSFVRMLDNVNDRTLVPLQEQKENLQNKRRIGIGYMGYGSALYLLKIRYGSEAALKLTDELASFVTNQCYQASARLAKEKGSFPLYDQEKFLASKFVKQALTPETIELITKYGLRNSHLTSIQPTGNGSIFANNVSGGLEPVFMPEYIRTSVVQAPPEDMKMPIIDWEKSTYYVPSLAKVASRPALNEGPWEWVKEGDESILRTDFEGTIYKIDRSRGLTKETLVEDYGVHLLKKAGEWDEDADWAVDTVNLSVAEHTDTMKVFAKYIDSAMSKTVNLPSDYSYDDFKDLYMDFYDSGTIKGGTTYRAGTMTTVLAAVKEEPKDTHRKRPKELDCDVHQLTVGGERWAVFVGLLDDKPYEVFAGLVDKVDLTKKITSGKLIKRARNKYSFVHEDILEIKDVASAFNNSTQGAMTRLLSTSLRHGVESRHLVTQLQKTGNGLNTFAKSIARTLKKYIREGEKLSIACESCESKEVVMTEGCNKCMSCGYSGCS